MVGILRHSTEQCPLETTEPRSVSLTNPDSGTPPNAAPPHRGTHDNSVRVHVGSDAGRRGPDRDHGANTDVRLRAFATPTFGAEKPEYGAIGAATLGVPSSK
jgi:hypothetical protein